MTDAFTDTLGAFAAALPTDEPAWLRAQRAAARARFDALGLPTKRVEDWKYTSVKAIARGGFMPPARDAAPTAAALEAHTPPELAAHRVVLVNGRLAEGLSSRPEALADGVSVTRWPAALTGERAALLEAHLLAGDEATHHPFAALNAALATDGVLIHVARGARSQTPIHLLHVSTNGQAPSASHARHLVVAERGAEVVLVEHHVGLAEAAYLSNVVTRVRVAEGARVEHVRVQREQRLGYHVGLVDVHQGRASFYANRSFSFGAALSRLDIDCALAGEGVECVLDGLYLGRGRQHVDHHTSVDHTHPHSESHELYKGVLEDRATGVFNGKVFVRRPAQKTNARQSNKNLLLSPRATINTKPQLEIFADDVRCTHGATIGQLDPDALFYLQSRGLDPGQARALMTFGFGNELVERVSLEGLRELLVAELTGWLPDVDDAAALTTDAP